MLRVRNFTPHPVEIFDATNLAAGPILVLASEGKIRVNSDPGADLGTIELNGVIVPIRTPYEMKPDLIGLPDLAENEYAIVSQMAYDAADAVTKPSLLMVDSDQGAVRRREDGSLGIGGNGQIEGTIRLLGLL